LSQEPFILVHLIVLLFQMCFPVNHHPQHLQLLQILILILDKLECLKYLRRIYNKLKPVVAIRFYEHGLLLRPLIQVSKSFQQKLLWMLQLM